MKILSIFVAFLENTNLTNLKFFESNVLGSSSIWTCRIWNIYYCFLQAVEKSKQISEIGHVQIDDTKDIKVRRLCPSVAYLARVLRVL